MRIFRYMWITDSLDQERKHLYEGLKNGGDDLSVFLIVLPENDTHVLDILPSKALKQQYYQNSGQWIIGAAATSEEASELAGSIIRTAFVKTGSTDVNAWLRESLSEAEDG